MNIRPAARSDLNQIAAIHIESWKDAYRDDLPADFFDQKIDLAIAQHWEHIEISSQDIVLVAEEDRPIGFVSVWCRPAPCIDNLHVKPACRSQNIGSALMRAAAGKMLDQGHRSACLLVFESNLKAIRFYERLGGVKKEAIENNIFGYTVSSRKIYWDDVSIILGPR